MKLKTEYQAIDGYSLPDGAEAEQLRKELEALIEAKDVSRSTVQDLLDRVDARDSLRYLEAKDKRFSRLRRRVNRLRVALSTLARTPPGRSTVNLAIKTLEADDQARRIDRAEGKREPPK